MKLSETEMNRYIEASQVAAKLGGAKLMEMMGTAKVSEKAPKDLVTEADLASQVAIENHLLSQFPDHILVGEEDTEKSGALNDDKLCWIVDPLDGTMNYVHQLRSFSVSIALRYQGELLVGTVYDPWLDECFFLRAKGWALRSMATGSLPAAAANPTKHSSFAVSPAASTVTIRKSNDFCRSLATPPASADWDRPR